MKSTWIYAVAILLLAVGCKEGFDTFEPDPGNPIVDPITFDASVLVEVEATTGEPVEGATVSLGTEQLQTDEHGIAVMKDVTMSSSTYLTVNQTGYFHGSRRFYPTEGKSHYVKVVLLPDNPVAQMDAGTGGNIQISPEVSILFPPASIVDETGLEYSGMVDIAAHPITADDPELSVRMPGDLVGLTSEGEFGALASAGMVAVELRSSSGEKLNIKPGAEVDMRMTVPASMSGSVPGVIPMWYFDEAEGVWKEDGEAVLQGNEYVASVSHFTYWNYDAWFPITKWGTTVQFADGSPAAEVSVCVTILSMQARKCAFTNEDGEVCGMVPTDEVLLIEVEGPCGDIIYSEEIGPFSDTTFTGPITIPDTEVVTTAVSGSAVDCDGNAVTNGYVILEIGDSEQVFPVDDDGTFSRTIMNCNEADVTVTIIDADALKQSLPQTFEFAPVINTGQITACDDLQEFIQMDVTGLPDPVIFVNPSILVSQSLTRISTVDSSNQVQFFFVSFIGTSPGTYSSSSAEVGVEIMPGTVAFTNELEIIVTYFGDEGDFVQGTFSGTLNDGSNDYPMTGLFSVLRE